MSKIFILILFVSNIALSKTCFIHEGKSSYTKLQACDDGNTLHFYITNFEPNSLKESNETLLTISKFFCDSYFKINIFHDNLKSTLTCIFKNNFKK